MNKTLIAIALAALATPAVAGTFANEGREPKEPVYTRPTVIPMPDGRVMKLGYADSNTTPFFDRISFDDGETWITFPGWEDDPEATVQALEAAGQTKAAAMYRKSILNCKQSKVPLKCGMFGNWTSYSFGGGYRSTDPWGDTVSYYADVPVSTPAQSGYINGSGQPVSTYGGYPWASPAEQAQARLNCQANCTSSWGYLAAGCGVVAAAGGPYAGAACGAAAYATIQSCQRGC